MPGGLGSGVDVVVRKAGDLKPPGFGGLDPLLGFQQRSALQAVRRTCCTVLASR